MYSRSFILLFAVNIMCAAALVFSRGMEAQAESSSVTKAVELERFESVERVISYNTITLSYCISVSDEDIENLMKLVQAEAGGEDRTGKLLVANVVINRVKSVKFPNNVTDVVFQKAQSVTQFSPVSNGSIYNVVVSEETREAVYSALYGEDVSQGALFFMARKYADAESAAWFDNNLTYLFSYGGHDFFVQ